MNRSWFLCLSLLVVLMSSFTAHAQQACNKCINANGSFTFLGIDYSQAKFVGVNQEHEQKLKDVYMPAWNYLFINEQQKYDVAKMLKVDKVTYMVDFFEASNAQLKDVYSQNDPQHSESDVRKYIQTLSLEKVTTDYAVWFMASAYNKSQEYGSHYFIIYDVKAKEVLVLAQFKENPRGFSFRNYWAFTYYKAMESIQGRMAKSWMK